MSLSRFDAKEMSIGALLSEGFRVVVPIHQRDFRWTSDELEQYFDDINEALESKQEDYFIGLMVFIERGKKELVILDGQQRIASTVIFFSCVRNWLNAHDYARDAEKIQNDFISLRELGSTELESRIILNENNNPYFDDYVIHETPINDVESSLKSLGVYDQNRPLISAILDCHNYIGYMLRDIGSREGKAELLFNYTNYVKDHVKLVRFIVPNDSNAFTIFETLNDRGLDLTILDLVKNHIFGIIRDPRRIPGIHRNWNQMMSNLSNVPADNFLKAYWTSRNGRTQKAQLFPAFKSNITKWNEVSFISKDMLASSELYAGLENPYDPIWSGLQDISRKRIQAFEILGARQIHPILLSALEIFDIGELERLLHLLEVLIVRYQFIGGRRTGLLEITCSGLSHEIYQEKITNTSQTFEYLKDLYPTDDDFEIDFLRKQEKNSRKVRYVLSKLEAESRRRAGQEMGEELETIDSLTIEHVFPRTPSDEWETLVKQDPDIVKDCTNTLGNLCLLSAVNRALGNSGFDNKKGVFVKSSLRLTNMLGGYSNWNRESIQNRQRHMANLALSVWRYPA